MCYEITKLTVIPLHAVKISVYLESIITAGTAGAAGGGFMLRTLILKFKDIVLIEAMNRYLSEKENKHKGVELTFEAETKITSIGRFCIRFHGLDQSGVMLKIGYMYLVQFYLSYSNKVIVKYSVKG